MDLEGKTIREFKGGDIVPLHLQKFVDAVRARDRGMLNATVENGHHSTGWANIANIAFRVGAAYDKDQLTSAQSSQSLKAWPLLIDEMEHQLTPFGVTADQLVSSPVLSHDHETEKFVGEHAGLANRFLRRTCREKYVVPEIG